MWVLNKTRIPHLCIVRAPKLNRLAAIATAVLAGWTWQEREMHVFFLRPTLLAAVSQELCGLAKHLQVGARTSLLNKLADLGLFKVRTAAEQRVGA